MVYNDRFAAVEGQTVRLNFRNYVGNVLTDVDSLSVSIQPRGNSTVLASFNLTNGIVQEGIGSYYVDWTIPSSVPGNIKFSGLFAGVGGPGFYQDIWAVTNIPESPSLAPINVETAQDFYINSAENQTDLLEVIEPLKFDYTIADPRLEKGAKDYVTISISERNGRLVDGESTFPDGEIQLISNNKVILNYSPAVHKINSNQYKYFIDTTPLREGIYKLQLKLDVDEATVNTGASVTGSKSLFNGFLPTSNELLQLTVDGITKDIPFPTTVTDAEVSINVANPNTLSFFAGSNDVFIVDFGGSIRERRILNAPSDRKRDDLVDELNGVWPDGIGGIGSIAFEGNTYSFPALTSAFDLSGIDFNDIAGTDMQLSIDGVLYSIQFSSSVDINTIDDEINAALNATGDVAFVVGSTKKILLLSPRQSTTFSNAKSITTVTGDSLRILGFTEGQTDSSPNGLRSSATGVNVASGGVRIDVSESTTPESDAETFSINAITYEFESGGGVGGGNIAVTVGIDSSDSLSNLKTAIDSNDATVNTSLVDDVLIITPKTIGTNLPYILGTVGDWATDDIIVLESDVEISILSPTEGSVANDSLGFNPSGIIASTVPEVAAGLQGENLSPVEVVSPTPSVLTSIPDLPEFDDPSGFPINDKTITITLNDGTTNRDITATFNNTLSPPAITSLFQTASFNLKTGNTNGSVFLITYDDQGTPDATPGGNIQFISGGTSYSPTGANAAATLLDLKSDIDADEGISGSGELRTLLVNNKLYVYVYDSSITVAFSDSFTSADWNAVEYPLYEIPANDQQSTGGNNILRIDWEINDTTPYSVSAALYEDPNPGTVNSIPSKAVTLQEIIVKIQDAVDSVIPNTIIVDSVNSRLRIRGKNTTVTRLAIDKDGPHNASAVLGFDNASTIPEEVYQNDQLLEPTSGFDNGQITGGIYYEEFTLNDIVTAINTASNAEVGIENNIASISGTSLVLTNTDVNGVVLGAGLISILTSNDPNTTGTVASEDLGFGASYPVNGSTPITAQNASITIITDEGTIDELISEIVFQNGVKDVNYFVDQINTQASNAFAEVVTTINGFALKISHTIAGSGKKIAITNDVGNLSGLGFIGSPFPFNFSTDAGDGDTTYAIFPADLQNAIATGENTPITKYTSAGNAILKIRTTDSQGLFREYVSVDLEGDELLTEVLTSISTAAIPDLTILISPDGKTLVLRHSGNGGSLDGISIASFDEGSTANPSLSISANGAESIGTDGIPFTINQIVQRINASFSGQEVALDVNNFLRLQSIEEGAQAKIIIGNKTTNGIISDIGLSKGSYVGLTESRVRQTIVSNKLTITIGE